MRTSAINSSSSTCACSWWAIEDDPADRHVARVLAESVPGVQAVTVAAKPS
ncbi:hypothetical protein ACTG9Q_31410 [Actinokineospora sp. 24-640]